VHDVAQRHTVDVLHHDVGQRPGGRLRLAGVVHRDDRRVVERRRVLRFPPGAQVERGGAGQVGAQHLDRYVSVQPDIPGQVDLGHATEAEDLTEFVAVGQVLRGRTCGFSWWDTTAKEKVSDGARLGVSSWHGPPGLPAAPRYVQLVGCAGGDSDLLRGARVSVTVGVEGCCCELLLCEFITIRIAVMMPNAPRTTAAHSSAR